MYFLFGTEMSQHRQYTWGTAIYAVLNMRHDAHPPPPQQRSHKIKVLCFFSSKKVTNAFLMDLEFIEILLIYYFIPEVCLLYKIILFYLG